MSAAKTTGLPAHPSIPLALQKADAGQEPANNLKLLHLPSEKLALFLEALPVGEPQSDGGGDLPLPPPPPPPPPAFKAVVSPLPPLPPPAPPVEAEAAEDHRPPFRFGTKGIPTNVLLAYAGYWSG